MTRDLMRPEKLSELVKLTSPLTEFESQMDQSLTVTESNSVSTLRSKEPTKYNRSANIGFQ